MNNLLKLQSNLFMLTSVLSLILGYGVDPRANILLLLTALCFIVLMGVPHGSLDVLFARQTLEIKYLRHWAKFFIYYITAAACIILLWILIPSIFFITFLILSALHFSDDLNLPGFNALKFSYGASIITLPSLYFNDELIDLYAMIIERRFAADIVQISHFASVFVILILAVQLLSKEIKIRAKLETICVFILFLVLHPILAFGIYFCVMHSARHIIRSHFFLRNLSKKAFLYALILPTSAVIIIGGVIGWIGENKSLEIDMIRIIFVGLAALTVPHAWVLKKSNFQAWSILQNNR